MELPLVKLVESIEYCLLPKLARNFDESEYHLEYEIRKSRLAQHFPVVLKLLEENPRETLKSTRVLSSLLIIFYELQTTGPWNTQEIKKYLAHLNNHFELEALLQKDETINNQGVFDECLENLHQKLTSLDFKKYPSLIGVYSFLIQNVQIYNVTLSPVKSLPISLLLIDDYNATNKVKGLQCCHSILQHLSPHDFSNGNYYEVIFGYLKKVITEKDVEITKLVHQCFRELLRVLPSNVKVTKTDAVYSTVLDQLLTEANLYRRAELFIFTKNLIQIHQVNCVGIKSFLTVVCDALDVCCNEAVGEILLGHVLECLEEWIRYCWCIWHLPTDQKLLTVLLKCLYVCKDDNLAQLIVNLISTLISLCTDDEQKQISKSLEKSSLVKSEQFEGRINLIKKNMNVK